MNQQRTNWKAEEPRIEGLFPNPLYFAKRDFSITLDEEKDINDIFKAGIHKNDGNYGSVNSYVFDDNLKNLKQFCEEHIKKYVDIVLNPIEDLDFYITQSWLNITKPGGHHHDHFHGNSIISGVFYISAEEGDTILFTDVNRNKGVGALMFPSKAATGWTSSSARIPSVPNELLLFPSWINHRVLPNEKATKDRISLSFNTFVRGRIGDIRIKNELILK